MKRQLRNPNNGQYHSKEALVPSSMYIKKKKFMLTTEPQS